MQPLKVDTLETWINEAPRLICGSLLSTKLCGRCVIGEILSRLGVSDADLEHAAIYADMYTDFGKYIYSLFFARLLTVGIKPWHISRLTFVNDNEISSTRKLALIRELHSLAAEQYA